MLTVSEISDRAKKALEGLRAKKLEVQEELAKLRQSNKAAWETYGSELCAQDMTGQERLIEGVIDGLDKNIKLMEQIISSRCVTEELIRDGEVLQLKKIIELDGQIGAIREIREGSAKLLGEIRIMKSLLDIE